MIMGAHMLLYSSDAEADRAFLRDVMGFRFVDDGGGWLIFALPPAEVAVHPADSGAQPPDTGHQMMGAMLFLMCDDLQSTIKMLASKGVACAEPRKQAWGTSTAIQLPSGGRIGVYQPTHQTPLGLGSMENFGALGQRTKPAQ